MAIKDLRTWIETLETNGELKRIKANVDWGGEIAEIRRQVLEKRGPAILFENIKDHENTWCRKLLVGDLTTTKRIALMLGLSKDTPRPDIIKVLKRRLKEPIRPEHVVTGAVKENIVRGDEVDLFQIPVPKWHPLDGGRYINTWCGVVTMDPENGDLNVGTYRGMITSRNKIGVFLIPAKGWGVHYDKYRGMGKPMPVAIVYGWDPSMVMAAGIPLTNISEYEAMGAIRQEPVPLCKCETSDLMVPCSAEIVVEGTIATMPITYEMEGPYGEAFGFYGEQRNRPVVQVDCITFRNNPIYVGALTGLSRPGVMVSDESIAIYVGLTSIIWNTLELQGIPGILDVIPAPITVVKIRKTYQGQPRQVAAAIWGARLSINSAKIIMVVEEDVDIHDPRQLLNAMLLYVDPARDIIVFPMELGELDPALSFEAENHLKYGAALQSKLLIDATVDWITHPVREELGGRLPPTCTEPQTELVEMVRKRWMEYGL